MEIFGEQNLLLSEIKISLTQKLLVVAMFIPGLPGVGITSEFLTETEINSRSSSCLMLTDPS